MLDLGLKDIFLAVALAIAWIIGYIFGQREIMKRVKNILEREMKKAIEEIMRKRKEKK